MDRVTVIARGYGGKPLARVLCDVQKGKAYLANPEVMDRVRRGESGPIGFPLEDVYEFDAAVLGDLMEQWRRNETTDPNTWSRLHPLENASLSTPPYS
jgi:hypothetical protein